MFRLKKIKMHEKQMKKNLTRVFVDLTKITKSSMLFEIIGKFPPIISEVYDPTLNIKPGDYIVEINDKNVSRASAKSVRKIIK